MKQRLVPILVAVALLGMALSVAANFFRGSAKQPDALGGRLTVELLPGWKTVESLNPLANLKVGDPVADVYLIVVSEKKTDAKESELGRYSLAVRQRLISTLAASSEQGPWWISVGAHRAVRYEIRGRSQDGMDVTYLHTVIETPEYFHQAVGWGEAKNYVKHRGTIRKIADSLREDGR